LQKAERIAAGSIAVGFAVLGLKLAAWRITGSAALFSDGIESVINVITALLALFALKLSALPADANHPYGHHKVEFLSAVVEGVLIILAAGEILQHAWAAFRHPLPLQDLGLGMGINFAATVLNLVWAQLLLRTGRQIRSPALIGDGRHLMSDVATSSGVLAGVGLVLVTGVGWLDPLLAALTACYILVAGTLLIRDSVSGLMDAAPSPAVVEQVRAIIAREAHGALQTHDLRMRTAGPRSFIEFHLVVPGAMTVAEAHGICDRMETALAAQAPGLALCIHIEPETMAKHGGTPVG
jgi:cation diffusion facilitator family transporter